MGKRLSDTEALVRRGINPPGPKLAPFGGNLGHECGADNAVGQGRNSGHYRRETNAGGEGLTNAVGIAKED